MHLRNITHFDFVDTGIDFQSKLHEIEKKYGMLANSDPLTLRKLIPSNEIWRFFITKMHQQSGRGIKHSSLPALISSYENVTIYDYLILFEKIDLSDPNNIRKSSIYSILEKHLWSLSIDELKHFTFKNILDLDVGWIPYEINEPGYLKSLHYAFNEIFSKKDLTIDLIKKIHEQCIAFTRKTRYESPSYKNSRKDQFRGYPNGAISYVNQRTASPEGIEEIINKQTLHQYNHLEINISCDNFTLYITPRTLKVIQDNYTAILNDTAFVASILGVEPSYFILHPKLYQGLKSALAYISISPVTAIYDMSRSNTYKVALRSHSQSNMTDKLGATLNKYNQNILNAHSAHQKIMAITVFIQDCAQLVPLDAANGRVFTMITLNMLLVRNGFPLTILEDQDEFIGYSTEQLMSEILKGMENTFTLIKENKLFDVETSVICQKLIEANFDRMDKYFHDLQWLEEGFRQDKSASSLVMKNNQLGLRFFCNKTEKDLINQLKNVLEDLYPDGIENLNDKAKEHVNNMYKLISFLDNKFLTENNKKIIQEYIASLENQIAERNKVRPK